MNTTSERRGRARRRPMGLPVTAPGLPKAGTRRPRSTAMLTDPGADRGPAHYRPNGSQVLSSVEPSSAPERTCTTLPSAVGVCERSHAHGSRTRTVPNGPSRQPLTSRRFTGPTVTFSRPAASRFRTPTGPRGSHSRSVLKMTVGHCSLGHAHHPHGVGAGAGCALSRPSGGASLARRSRLCDNV